MMATLYRCRTARTASAAVVTVDIYQASMRMEWPESMHHQSHTVGWSALRTFLSPAKERLPSHVQCGAICVIPPAASRSEAARALLTEARRTPESLCALQSAMAGTVRLGNSTLIAGLEPPDASFATTERQPAWACCSRPTASASPRCGSSLAWTAPRRRRYGAGVVMIESRAKRSAPRTTPKE